MRSLITGARIFTGDRFLDQHAILLEGESILAVAPLQDLPSGLPTTMLDGGILAPGFVDLQVNGGGGVLFNNQPDLDGLTRMTEGHRSAGTTALLPTTISSSRANLTACIDAVMHAHSRNRSILGIHIEGPFFNPIQKGVHHEQFIRPLTDDDIDFLATTAQDLPMLLTLAPEMTEPGQIQRLVSAGIRVSAGHSNADYQQAQRAIDEGLSGFTHLYNAMRPLQGREPGMVGAALANDSTWAGIIVDNFHVHPASVRLAYQAKPRGRLYLVSDSMATVGSTEPSFDLYGETITAVDGRLINAAGRLAGSAISLAEAVRSCVEDVGIPLTEALCMASRYPLEYLGQDHERGWIRPGYRADLTHLSDNLTVRNTWVSGVPVSPPSQAQH